MYGSYIEFFYIDPKGVEKIVDYGTLRKFTSMTDVSGKQIDNFMWDSMQRGQLRSWTTIHGDDSIKYRILSDHHLKFIKMDADIHIPELLRKYADSHKEK